MKPNEMNLFQRIKANTPPFFKKVRNIGILLAAIGGSLVALPAAVPLIVIPAIIIKIGSILIAAGTVAASVSQTAVDEGK